MVRSRTGQALVEFALVAPIVLLIIGATVDLGRGMLLYGLLTGASRDTARQATLQYYSGSNTLPPDCSALTTPCGLTSLVNVAHLLDPLGVAVVYADSGAISSPPGYGSYTANGTEPGKITLTGAATNTVYVFIYEVDAAGTTRWSCSACVAVSGKAVRMPGHQRVVVDLKLSWQPVLAHLLGLPATITFDSQTVDRIEY
jgi:Flp pilus assembly protein TadG